MTFQTTFDLEVFIKSCNALRLSVCSDGEATLDKWMALATKKSVDGKITFTKQKKRGADAPLFFCLLITLSVNRT